MISDHDDFKNKKLEMIVKPICNHSFIQSFVNVKKDDKTAANLILDARHCAPHACGGVELA